MIPPFTMQLVMISCVYFLDLGELLAIYVSLETLVTLSLKNWCFLPLVKPQKLLFSHLREGRFVAKYCTYLTLAQKVVLMGMHIVSTPGTPKVMIVAIV